MGTGASILRLREPTLLGLFASLPHEVLEHLLRMCDANSLCIIRRCGHGLRSSADSPAVWESLLRRSFGLSPAGLTLLEECGKTEGSTRDLYVDLQRRDAEAFDAELLSRRVKQASAVAAEPWLWTLGLRLEMRNPFPCAAWLLFCTRPASGAPLWPSASSEGGGGARVELALAHAPTCKGYTSLPRMEGPGAQEEPSGVVLMSLQLRAAADARGAEADHEAWGVLLPPCVPPPSGGGGGQPRGTSGRVGGAGDAGRGPSSPCSSSSSDDDEAAAPPPDLVIVNRRMVAAAFSRQPAELEVLICRDLALRGGGGEAEREETRLAQLADLSSGRGAVLLPKQVALEAEGFPSIFPWAERLRGEGGGGQWSFADNTLTLRPRSTHLSLEPLRTISVTAWRVS